MKFIVVCSLVIIQFSMKMERESNSVVETISILDDVTDTLKNRLETKFVPTQVKTLFGNNNVSNETRKKIETEFINVYQDALDYLEKWTDQFSGFRNFEWMSLDKIPTWQAIEKTILYLRERNITIDDNRCIDQYRNLKRYIENYPEIKEKSVGLIFSYKSTMKNSFLNF